MSKTYDLSTFFRLLAEENITIIEGDFETASVDLESRTMRIPAFSALSENVRILFGAHEAGHFRYTPISLQHEFIENRSKYPKNFFPFINLIEDIRIEKKVKNRFPGLVSKIEKGYLELLENGFFGEKPFSRMKYFSQVNTKSKLRSAITNEFTGKDLAVYKYLTSIDKPEDVIPFAKFLYLYCKEKADGSSEIDDDFEKTMKKIESMTDDEFSEFIDGTEQLDEFEDKVKDSEKESAASSIVSKTTNHTTRLKTSFTY